MTQTIIDCHVHVNGYESLKNLPLKERIESLSNTMQSNKVDQAIIISSYTINEERPSTGEILSAIEKHEKIKVVAGYSISNHDESSIKEYEEYLKTEKYEKEKNCYYWSKLLTSSFDIESKRHGIRNALFRMGRWSDW